MKRLNFISLISIFLLLTGCEFSFWASDQETEYGKLIIHLTDAPFPFDIVEEANITINRVEIRNESDSNEDEFLVIFEDTVTFNLLELRNGLKTVLVEADIPAGRYNTIRLYVLESSMLLTDQRTFDIKVPSGEQTGIKIKIDPDIVVNSIMDSEVLLDFDLSKSFVLNGITNKADMIKGFIFKPVVRAVNYCTAGKIAGTVFDPDKAVLENMEVWIEADSIIARSFTNTECIYGLLGIPEGSYSMYATGEGYDTAVHEVVEVLEGDRIIKNFTLNPL